TRLFLVGPRLNWNSCNRMIVARIIVLVETLRRFISIASVLITIGTI
ncbi:unnamed protein product, partial [marine sediment metagenome]